MNHQDTDLALAHEQSIHNREQIEDSELCGCFHCLKIYSPSKIEAWADKETTAVCPYCGIDSIIGSASNYTITVDFLKAIQKKWFLHELDVDVDPKDEVTL